MGTFTRRLVALVVSVLVSSGNAAICEGWAPTPEARMACCADGTACPMHDAESHGGSHSDGAMTQAQADSCCASSERDHSNQSSPTFVVVISSAVLGPGVVVPVTVPALVLSDAWRASAPLPTTPIPKYVLLSVFLV